MYRYIVIFFATIPILYIEQAIAIFMIHLHMHQQTWESSLQLVLTLLPLMHGDFPNKLTRKIHAEQCLALYSRWWTPTHACFQCQLYRLLSPRARHKAIPFLFCCYVMYCIVYRIVTTVSGYVSYRGKMYCCRPSWRALQLGL